MQQLFSLLLAVFLVGGVIAQTKQPQSWDEDRVQSILNKSVDNKNIFRISIAISSEEQTASYSAGTIHHSDPYFLASITKLYTSSVIFSLADKGLLNLSDPIQKYLPENTMENLHILDKKDHASAITLYHLITNTSGLPDYFEGKDNNGKSLMDHLKNQGDTLLTFEQMMHITKSMQPLFPPGEKGRAHYSDGNFQLLGKIIESITKKPMREAYQDYIIEPLELQNTYLYSDPGDTSPKTFYHGNHIMSIPKMMTSFQSDGGIVSTPEEGIQFLKAFFEEKLFSQKHLSLDGPWNKIFSPFQYGVGMMRFKFPGMPELIGHAGASGSFAYYVAQKKVYIVGSINQINKQDLVYKLIGKILREIK